MKLKRLNLINAKTVFTSTLIVIPTLTLIVYLTGLNQHRSLYYNSILSTSILSVIFLAFITTGLYKGWKLKDNLGNFMNKFDQLKKPSSGISDTSNLDLGFVEADGIEGCIVGIFAWIIIGVFGTIILWSIGAVIWAVILIIAGLLYWIIFRAYRSIFRNSSSCKNDFAKSLKMGLLFAFLYSCWIYAIILGTHFLNS